MLKFSWHFAVSAFWSVLQIDKCHKIFTKNARSFSQKKEEKIRRLTGKKSNHGYQSFEHCAESQFGAKTNMWGVCMECREMRKLRKIKRERGKLWWNEYHTKFNGAQILIVLLWEWYVPSSLFCVQLFFLLCSILFALAIYLFRQALNLFSRILCIFQIQIFFQRYLLLTGPARICLAEGSHLNSGHSESSFHQENNDETGWCFVSAFRCFCFHWKASGKLLSM